MRCYGMILATAVMMRYVGGVDSLDSVDSDESPVKSTVIEVLLGSGSYAEVTRDCNGRVTSVKDVPYTEFGAKVTHTISPLKLGVAAGVTTSKRSLGTLCRMNPQPGPRIPYVAPQIGLDTKYLGIDVGYLFNVSSGGSYESQNPYYSVARISNEGMPVAGVRIGRVDRTYFYLREGTNVPISVGNGIVDGGFGFGDSTQSSRFELGLGAIPDDGLMISTKAAFSLSDHLTLCLRGHIAPGDGFGWGGAAGLKVEF